MDPDPEPGGPKAYGYDGAGSGFGSGSATMHTTIAFTVTLSWDSLFNRIYAERSSNYLPSQEDSEILSLSQLFYLRRPLKEGTTASNVLSGNLNLVLCLYSWILTLAQTRNVALYDY